MFVKTILLILLLPRFTHCRLRARRNQSFLINISLKWLQKRHTPKTLLHDLQGNAPSCKPSLLVPLVLCSVIKVRILLILKIALNDGVRFRSCLHSFYLRTIRCGEKSIGRRLWEKYIVIGAAQRLTGQFWLQPAAPQNANGFRCCHLYCLQSQSPVPP